MERQSASLNFMLDSVSQKTSIPASGLLTAEGSSQTSLHAQAGETRDAHFGKKVFVRAVVEVSNYCRQNCSYCGMRRDNKELKRSRVSAEELLDLILTHRPAAVTDINIQAGEDPIAVREVVIPLIKKLRAQTSLGISVCLGTLAKRDFDELKNTGADYFIIKLETGDTEHYKKVQSPGTLAQRVEAIQYLASTGWKVSSGFIVGLPFQTTDHILKSLQLMKELPLSGCSVSPFIAGEQTPFADSANGNLETTLNCLAMMRIACPTRVIPAVSAMGLVGEDGYCRAIRAGANLATINLTPPDWRQDYVIYKRDRLIMNEQRVLAAIERAGCTPSTVSLCQSLKESSLTVAS